MPVRPNLSPLLVVWSEPFSPRVFVLNPEIRGGERGGLSLMERSPAVLQLLGVVRATAVAAQQRPGEEMALEHIEQVRSHVEIFGSVSCCASERQVTWL